ncbi:MAG: hypothetical protein C5B50_29520 [Verrucomicrobia bacterium]|nr:MAG: hypothetical protein C5B50_29520 [Verrucomicrobiota bacterium]
MELYYKDLISEEASLEKLVDDLALMVQGADEFVQAAAGKLPEEQKAQLRTRLQRLKQHCREIRDKAVSGARAADHALRLHPWIAVGVAFGAGLLAGSLIRRKR